MARHPRGYVVRECPACKGSGVKGGQPCARCEGWGQQRSIPKWKRSSVVDWRPSPPCKRVTLPEPVNHATICRASPRMSWDYDVEWDCARGVGCWAPFRVRNGKVSLVGSPPMLRVAWVNGPRNATPGDRSALGKGTQDRPRRLRDDLLDYWARELPQALQRGLKVGD